MLHNLIQGLTTNTATLDPSASVPELRPWRLAPPPAEVLEKIEAWAESQPRWSVASKTERGIKLVRTTRLIRFRDDIELHVTLEDGESVVHATSQSRVGKGDLGQNRRNLKELHKVVAEF